MGAIISEILPLAVGIAIGPLPIAVVILLLTGQRGKLKGLTYLVGWLIGLILLMLTVFLFIRGHDYSPGSGPSLLVSWVKLLAGISLFVAAYLNWRQRLAPGAKTELPGWLKTIQQVTLLVALGVGLLLGLVSPKNLVLATAAATTIGQAHLSISQAVMAVLLFVMIASSGVATPVYISVTKGEQAELLLADWGQWLSVNNATILCVLCLIIGADLFGDALGGLL